MQKGNHFPDHDYFNPLLVAKKMLRVEMTIELVYVNGVDKEVFHLVWK